MCGLMAGSGKIESKILTALGCLNEERGTDSAGVAWVEDGKVKIEKIAQHPLVAFPVTLNKSMRNATLMGPMGVCIGHTRQATTGAVTSANAHPFLVDTIAFAHNGMIANHAALGKYEVDSECLIDGIKAKDFSKYEGSIALVWIEDGKLHAYRKGNPLFRGIYHGGMYLASNRKHLESVGCQKVKELSEGRIYIFLGAAVISSKSVPTNTLRSYTKYTTYAAEGDYGYGSQHWDSRHWDKDLGRWVYDSEIGAKEPETADVQETCITPARQPITTLGPVTPVVLTPSNSSGLAKTSRADIIDILQKRHDEAHGLRNAERRKNRFGFTPPEIIEADTLAEADALGSLCELCKSYKAMEGIEYCEECADFMSRDEKLHPKCLACGEEPCLPGQDYGQACALEYGMMSR